MSKTIYEFVEKLKVEGIEAGKAEAERIRAEAKEEADKIIKEAKEQAKTIIENAQKEANETKMRVETEIKLAARDTVLKLREVLLNIIRSILQQKTKETLKDEEFIKSLLHDIIMQFVQTDCMGRSAITINVPDEMKHKLTHWTITLLQEEPELHGRTINIEGKLKEVGFEYKIREATVEITTESVVNTLMELTGPEVKAIIKKAMENLQDKEDAS